jgi:hypothetical protein
VPNSASASFWRFGILRVADRVRAVFAIADAADLIFPARVGADRNCIWSPEDKGFCNVR